MTDHMKREVTKQELRAAFQSELRRTFETNSLTSQEYHPMQDIELLVRFDEDKVSEKERKDFLHHIAHCEECCERFKIDRELAAMFPPVLPDSFKSQARPSWTAAAKQNISGWISVAALVLCCVFGGLLMQNDNTVPNGGSPFGAKGFGTPQTQMQKQADKTPYYLGLGIAACSLAVSLASYLHLRRKNKQEGTGIDR